MMTINEIYEPEWQPQDPDEQQDEMNAALLGNAKAGRSAGVDEWLTYGAFVNCRNELEQTPLMLAVIAGNAATVNLLLTNGADVALLDYAGMNAMDHLEAFLQQNAEVIDMNDHIRTDLASRGLDLSKTPRNYNYTEVRAALTLATLRLIQPSALPDQKPDKVNQRKRL